MPRRKTAPVKKGPIGAKKIYSGRMINGFPFVFVDDEPLIRIDPDVDFDWGKEAAGKPNRAPQVTHLALAITCDLLEDEREARLVYMRLKQRTVMTWPRGEPWSVTGAELLVHIEDMRRIERETGPMRAAVTAQSLPPGMGGAMILGANVVISKKDQGPSERDLLAPRDPANKALADSALAKLTPEERKALGL